MLRLVLVRAVVASLFVLGFLAYDAPWGPFGRVGNSGLNAIAWWSGLVILGVGAVVILVHERPRRISGVAVPVMASAFEAFDVADSIVSDTGSPIAQPHDPAHHHVGGVLIG